MLKKKQNKPPNDPSLVVDAHRHALRAHECLEEADRHVHEAFPSFEPDWEAVDRSLNKATAHALTSIALRGGFPR